MRNILLNFVRWVMGIFVILVIALKAWLYYDVTYVAPKECIACGVPLTQKVDRYNNLY